MVVTPDALQPGTPPGFQQWCIVELFGHQRFAGLLTQADWPPGFGRLDIPATTGHKPVTQLVNPSSIYRLTPTTEEIATAVAASCRPEPVHRYELETAQREQAGEPAAEGWVDESQHPYGYFDDEQADDEEHSTVDPPERTTVA